MTKGRLEAFSDGVVAILITIMVLELKVPHGDDWHALRQIGPAFCTYVLSFVFLGIYWNNHHHLLHATLRVNGKILWANLHLLFWLSLVPVVTGWMGETHLAPVPTAIYGAVLLFAGLAYWILQNSIIAHQGRDSKLAEAVGRDTKAIASLVLYTSTVPLAFFRPWMSAAIYVLTALMWLVPDPRIEAKIDE
jgi:TMEM175 potassium channel family protein